MANVLTNLAADIYKAADGVGRELTGSLPSGTINAQTARAALNDTVRSHFTRAVSVGTITAAMTIPEGTDQTVDSKTMSLDTTASVKIPWTGEDMKHVANGSGFETIYGDQIRQAIRAIVNQIEVSLWMAAYKASSRAHGTAGTTPFASTFNDLAQIRKILVDNGCPMDGNVTAVMNTTAGANLRSLAQLQKANEAGGTELLRQGTLLDLQGLMIKESAGISTHTKGTGTSYQLSAAGDVADTTINVDTGSGTLLAGDVVTFAGTSSKYVANTTLSGGVFTIGSPGLLAIEADNDAITIGDSYTPNVAFHRSALELAIRPYAQPQGGDAAVDAMIVQDPWSGLVFEVRAYKGYGKAMFDVQCVYGVKAWKPNHIATLLG